MKERNKLKKLISIVVALTILLSLVAVTPVLADGKPLPLSVGTASPGPISYMGDLGTMDGEVHEVGCQTINNPDAWNYYYFYGEAGDSVEIILNRVTPEADPSITLFYGVTDDSAGLNAWGSTNPDMEYIDFADDEIWYGTPYGDPWMVQTLPYSGLYTLAAQDYIGDCIAGEMMAYEIDITGINPSSGIYPEEVDVIVFPGGSVDIEKTIMTPVIPPIVDIVFLMDTTGSMFEVISNLQTNIGTIMSAVQAASPDARFGAAQYRDFGSTPVYELSQAITADTAAVQLAVDSWSAGAGGDTPEAQLYALDQLATDIAVGFREDSTRIIVWMGDASGHDPSGGVTLADAIADLTTDGDNAPIQVIAIDVDSGYADGLDATGQATAITGATGGVLLSDAAPSEVSDAIMAGLTALPVEVCMASTCDGYITTTFVPSCQTVISGQPAVFTETISVSADTPGGTYHCHDYVLLNGEPMEGAVESKTIRVPEGFMTGGGQIREDLPGKKKNDYKVSFAGTVGFLEDFTIVGHWNMNLHNVGNDSFDKAHFKTTEITYLQFLNTDPWTDPTPPDANASICLFDAIGELNGEPGWGIEVGVIDSGEPGVDDMITFVLVGPSGEYYAQWNDFTSEPIDIFEWPGTSFVGQTTRAAGNLQIHSGIKTID